MDSSTRREAAFEAFKAEFRRNGYDVPNGLIDLLEHFTLKRNETGEQARSRIYRRLWAILWFGSGQKLGNPVRGTPTYVYPPLLKRVIREVVPGQLHDKPDPSHINVYSEHWRPFCSKVASIKEEVVFIPLIL